jgi:hypothetical protein
MREKAKSGVVQTCIDDPNLAETFVNGPISINAHGSIVTILLTIARPDFEQLIKGERTTKVGIKLVSRLAMPQHVALQLRDVLNKTFSDLPVHPEATMPGPSLPQ